ncbi:hypothetical protein [Inquilinus sp. Marseille-Q2685]|uniref:hypothetical protein n=1 Tax=Inquilinus sp. Marseille-Q2685 TaxID=2866581 RepID=UPI001CE3E972|nr:hypothetical protein [Inquilinus sp. Marseille-Q2685]
MTGLTDRFSAWLAELCQTRPKRPADDLEAQLGHTGTEPIELDWMSRTDLAPMSAVEWSTDEVEHGCAVGRYQDRPVLAGSVNGRPVVVERSQAGEMRLLTSTFAPGETVLSGGDGIFIPDRLGVKRTESVAGATFEVHDGTYNGRIVEVLRTPGTDSFQIREVERDASGAETVRPGAIVRPARTNSAEFVDLVTRLPDASSPEAAPVMAFPDGDKPNTISKAKATTGSPIKEFPKSGLVEIGKDEDRKFYVPVLVRMQRDEDAAGGAGVQDEPPKIVYAEYRPSVPGIWGEGTLVLRRELGSGAKEGPAVKYDAHNGRWVSPEEYRKAMDQFVDATMKAVDQGIMICFRDAMDGALALQMEAFRSQVRNLARQAIANDITEDKFQEGVAKVLSEIGKKGEDTKYRNRTDSQINWTRVSQVVSPLIAITMGAVSMYLIQQYRAERLAAAP